MPRIDPVQLLKCLSVLLSPNGGIKSKDEVQRLASLMTKFSKKLVSKCIYIQILKQTETELLGSFMGSGGWTLIHVWLSDGIVSKNYPLIQELLELLLLCPVDVERLKLNSCPKLIKGLTKANNHEVVQVLASKLVEQWLKLVKGGSASPLMLEDLPQLISQENRNRCSSIKFDSDNENQTFELIIESQLEETVKCESNTEESDSISDSSVIKDYKKNRNLELLTDEVDSKGEIPVLKIFMKDGKKIVSKVTDKSYKKGSNSDKRNSDKESSKVKKRDSERSKSSEDSKTSRSSSDKISKSRHSSSSSDHNSKSNKSSSKNSKEKERRSSSSSKENEKYNSEKERSDKKYRDKGKSEKDRNRASIERNSEKNKSEKTKDEKMKEQSEKDPTKTQTMSIMKLGKIPKKTSSEDKNDAKKEKPSLSIEVRKSTDQNRPKTVKTFNSKFRSHGLEEEAKPPPPRNSVKKPTPPTPTISGLPAPKRASPSHNTDAPPEKKPKIVENVDRPGAIKLIPPKPKPTYLLESGSFMDALTASATTNKKEPRKRKRRTSGSKDDKQPLAETSPPMSPSTPTQVSNSSEEPKAAPFRFYQDTLDTEEEEKGGPKSPSDDTKSKVTESDNPQSPSPNEDDVVVTKTEGSIAESDDEQPSTNVSSTGLKGVLCVHKKKGPKKTLRWRDTNLEEVQYFELDETERVNVTKTFLDMKQMEHSHEREAFKKGRNLANEDFMEERMEWCKLIPMDATNEIVVETGKLSKEKLVQMTRQAHILQAIYFHKSMIPDSAAEPDFENHPVSEPTTIPLEDTAGNGDSVNDFQNTPWPEPKVAPASPSPMPNAQMYQPLPPFNPGFNNPSYPMGAFPAGPGMMPMPSADWPMNAPNIPMMPPDSMGMNMNMNMSPDMYMGSGMAPGPASMYSTGSVAEYPMMDSMNGPGYPQGYSASSMNRPMSQGGAPYGYQKGRGGGGIRGPHPRGSGHMGWRSKNPGNWNGPRGGGHRGSRLCTHFQKKGFCRQGDACPFVHSGGYNAY